MRARAARPPEWSDLVVACTDPQAANRLRAYLVDFGCPVTKVEARNVYVPWRGEETKLRGVFRFATEHGFARPTAVATAVQTRLAEIQRRTP